MKGAWSSTVAEGIHPARRFRIQGLPRWAPMTLGLLLWLCSLVLVEAVILPFFGGRVAGIVALGLLVLMVLACHLLCTFRLRPEKERP